MADSSVLRTLTRPCALHTRVVCSDCSVRGEAFCAAVPGPQLWALNNMAVHASVAAGATLLHAGDPADHVFTVTEGTFRLVRLLPDGRRQIPGFLAPGDFLGFGNSATYVWDVEAVTDSAICRFSRGEFERLVERFPAVERRLLEKAAAEIVVAQELALTLGRKSAHERLATFLTQRVERAERAGEAAPTGAVILTLPMSRSDIADHLGLTIETVSRTFTLLRQEGLIALAGPDRVTIPDRAALARTAEGG